jgi:membrane protease YdiL (CAAX protease family)
MTDETRLPDPPSPWHAPPPAGYPLAPPAAPPDEGAPADEGATANGRGTVEAGHEPPPPSGSPPYGQGSVPVAVATPLHRPWATSPVVPLHRPWDADVAAPPGGPPAVPLTAPGPFWPTSTAWMDFDPDRPARWGLPDVLLGILAFVVGSFLVGGAAIVLGAVVTGLSPSGFAVEHTGLVGIAALAGSWTATIGFLSLIAHLKGQGSLRRDFGFSFSWWDPLIGAGAAVVTLFLSGVVQALVAALSGAEPASNADAIFGDVMNDKPLLVVMALMASVGAPLVEEVLFRGLALRAIEKRFGGVAAVLGSSLVFGALHYQTDTPSPLPLIAGIAVYGLVFSMLTRWWRRLGPSVFTHIWVNTLATVTVLLPVLTK